MKNNILLNLGLIGALLFIGSVANSDGAQPAVAQNEVKFEAVGGSFDGSSLKGLETSFVFPISHRVGMQFDASGNSVDSAPDDLESLGGGMHIFWRDPSRMLLDLHLSTLSSEDFDVNQARFLAEFYWAATSLSVSTGLRFGDIADAILGELLLTQYFGDNLSLQIGLQSIDSHMTYAGGFNYRTSAKGLHLFGISLSNEENFDATLLGLRYYFGEHVANSQRDRELILQSSLFQQHFNVQALQHSQSMSNTGSTLNPSGGISCPPGEIPVGMSCVPVSGGDCFIN